MAQARPGAPNHDRAYAHLQSRGWLARYWFANPALSGALQPPSGMMVRGQSKREAGGQRPNNSQRPGHQPPFSRKGRPDQAPAYTRGNVPTGVGFSGGTCRSAEDRSRSNRRGRRGALSTKTIKEGAASPSALPAPWANTAGDDPPTRWLFDETETVDAGHERNHSRHSPTAVNRSLPVARGSRDSGTCF